MSSPQEVCHEFFKVYHPEYSRDKLYVPSDILREHNIKLPPKMTLRDPLGRSWIGKVAVWKDGWTWIGWKPFCKWNTE